MRARKPQMYSLFKVIKADGSRKQYQRVRDYAVSKTIAVRIWQDALIESAFTTEPLELRPIKRD